MAFPRERDLSANMDPAAYIINAYGAYNYFRFMDWNESLWYTQRLHYERISARVEPLTPRLVRLYRVWVALHRPLPVS